MVNDSMHRASSGRPVFGSGQPWIPPGKGLGHVPAQPT
nr:hypothetical protein [Kibdelosporangium sp. MJ126-NF4]CTQ96063.1 hypothetical protein [Kibdelosporangium sp. MJ126-NF4]